MIKPRMALPVLDLPLVGGGHFDLNAERPAEFTMIVVYRGLHCPVCKTYLREFNGRIDEFNATGVSSLAVSSDGAERAQAAKSEWGLDKLRVAYGMPIESGREWGLYVSRGITAKEPAEFLEPGLFLVRPDQTLYAASVQTMPFARPHFSDVLSAVQYITKNNYPARGEA
jgi:peroxiredoxin